jgi:hypothetical protein
MFTLKKIITTLLFVTITTITLYLGISTTTDTQAAPGPHTVTINQKSTQADPSTSLSATFTVVFSQAITVSSFTTADIDTTASTATGVTITSITQVAPNNGTTFDVVATATGSGDIVLSIPVSTVGFTSASLGNLPAYTGSSKIDNSGNIYTSEPTTGKIYKLNAAGVQSLFYTHPNVFSSDGLYVDSIGNILIHDATTNNIYKISPAGTILATYAMSILACAGAYSYDMTENIAGEIYLGLTSPCTSGATTGSIIKFSTLGVPTLLATPASAYQAARLVLDSTGNLYTLFLYNLTKTTPAGVTTVVFTFPAPQEGDSAMVIDSQDNVYFSTGNPPFVLGSIYKTTPSGVTTALSTASQYSQFSIDQNDQIYGARLSSPKGLYTIDSSGNETQIATSTNSPKTINSYGCFVVSSNLNFLSTTSDYTRVTKALTSGISDLTTCNGFTASTSTDNRVSLSGPTTDADGVPDAIEQAAPNGGDNNGDGIPDWTQTKVSSAPNPNNNGKYLTLEATGNCSDVSGYDFTTEAKLSKIDPTSDYPYGLHIFNLNCATPGASGTVNFIWDSVYDTSQWKYKKYNPTTQIYTDITSSVTYSQRTVGGVARTVSSYVLTDGGAFDNDGLVNGVIFDPAGPSISATLVSTGIPSNVASGSVALVTSSVLLIAIVRRRAIKGSIT